MKKMIVLVVIWGVMLWGSGLVRAEREYVDTTEAEAVLDLMDGLAKGQITNDDEMLIYLRRIYETPGYKLVCQYNGMNPNRNEMINNLARLCRKIFRGEPELIRGAEEVYYDLYQNRGQYREFVNRFKGWQPTESVLDRTYGYFPGRKPFAGTVYFVVDPGADGYTLVPDMLFSIYQMKTMIDEKGVDFATEIFPHEFHHILTKELLMETYREKVLDSSGLTYFIGYIMLEGYAVEATATERTKQEIYRMNQTDREICDLFAKLEAVIEHKQRHPERGWREIYQEYCEDMVDIYTVGVTMVQTIEKAYGRSLVVKALGNPPLFFFLYQQAARDRAGLYQWSPSTLRTVWQSFAG